MWHYYNNLLLCSFKTKKPEQFALPDNYATWVDRLIMEVFDTAGATNRLKHEAEWEKVKNSLVNFKKRYRARTNPKKKCKKSEKTKQSEEGPQPLAVRSEEGTWEHHTKLQNPPLLQTKPKEPLEAPIQKSVIHHIVIEKPPPNLGQIVELVRFSKVFVLSLY